MERNVTSTPNGDSRNYCLTGENANHYLKNTDSCAVVFTSQEKVAPDGFETTAKDITCQNVVPAKTIESGVLPNNQESPLVTIGAAEIAKEGITVVVDASGRVARAEEAKEDESRRAARERREIETSAEDKYSQNVAGSDETDPKNSSKSSERE